MPAIFELNEFGTLPLWGQALIAARMVRRGVLAVLPDASPDFRDRALVACATIERAAASNTVVRRYRGGASPLVRDGKKAWRSGKFDAVMAGDFDVIGAIAAK